MELLELHVAPPCYTRKLWLNLLFNFELLATLVPMAPNSHTYIIMKAECMSQQLMVRIMLSFFQNKQKFENFQNIWSKFSTLDCLKHDFLLLLILLTELFCWQILCILMEIWSNSCKKYRNIQKVDFPKIRSSEAFWEILPKLYYLQTEASILRLFVCRSWKILWSFINT